MESRKYFFILLALACIAFFAAGCTGSKPATATPAPAAPAAPGAAAITTAAPAVSTTPECPDKYEKGVWDYSWDTKWKGYASNHDIRDLVNGKEGEPDSWNGINAPATTVVKMTQKCRDVTGTIAFATDPVCTGTITGTIDKNQLTGVWKTSGCQPEDEGADGTISVTMASDNKTWIGKLISSNDPYKDHDDNPPNWAAKRV
jgi:hypothetical protein